VNMKRTDPDHRWTRLALSLCLCAFLAVPILSHRSEAASFACDAAKAPRERMICADPALSSADETLAATFKTALDAFSEEGRAEFRKSQRAWIQFTDTVCSTNRKTQPANPNESSTTCLKDEYSGRQKQLETAVAKSNPARTLGNSRVSKPVGATTDFRGFALDGTRTAAIGVLRAINSSAQG